MTKVNVFEVKARLSEYLDRAARGERIIVCRHNRPVAELRALETVRTEPRPIGPLPGRPQFDVSPSFFEPPAAEDLSAWEGGSLSDPLSAGWPRSASGGSSKVAESTGGKSSRPRRRVLRRSR